MQIELPISTKVVIIIHRNVWDMLILLLYHTHVLSNMQTDYVEFYKDNHIVHAENALRNLNKIRWMWHQDLKYNGLL